MLGGLVVILPEEMTKLALDYYLKKATAEIYEFVDKSRYGRISVSKDGVLYYSDWILLTQRGCQIVQCYS